MQAVKRFLLFMLTMAVTCAARAQNVEGQPIASQYGEYQVTSEGNGFSFQPDKCNLSAGGRNFTAFTSAVPVKVVDAIPANTEVSTIVNAFVSGSFCSVSLAGLNYPHTSFYLTSGTGGLQEALNNAKLQQGGNNTIVLNERWYELVAPRSPSAVIGSVSGSTSFGLVDVTTTPYTYYQWNGTAYVAASTGGGNATGLQGTGISTTAPTVNQMLQYVGGLWTPETVNATGGVTSFNSRTGVVAPASGDYTVSQVNGAAPLASPALTGTPTAPTQVAGDNSTRIATDAFVLANAPGGGVTSFNTRTGAVVSTTGDYTAAQVGADPAGAATTAQSNAETFSANASHLSSGTVSASLIPTLNQNTAGTAANLSGTPALPNGTTATTQTTGDNTARLATDAFVLANAGAGGGSVSGQANGVVPLGTAATAIGAQSHLDDGVTTAGQMTSSEPYAVVNAGTFGSAANYAYNQSVVGGCQPFATSYIANNASYYNVQYRNNMTAGTLGCVLDTSTTAGAFSTGVAGFAASADTGEVVGGYFEGFALANGVHAFGTNPVVQDIAGLTSNVGLVGAEVDVQPYNGPSTYASGVGIAIDLVNNTNNGGTYPFDALQVSARVNGGSTPAYWNNGLTFNIGSIAGAALYVKQTANATSSSNYGGPVVQRAYDSYWNGSSYGYVDWDEQLRWSANGTNPAYDELYWSVNNGSFTGAHYFTLDYYQGMALAFQQTSSSLSILQPSSATGSGSNIIASLPPATGTLPVYPSAPTANAIPLVSNATNYTLANSALSDNGATVTSTETISTPSLTVSGISGSTQCLQASSSGVVSGTGAACAGVASFNSRTGAVTPASGDYTVSQVTGAAPLASPTFTGTPAAPTQAISTNNTDIATTAAVATALGSYAPLASPALTGTPTASTATGGTNTTQLATTAFVAAAVSGLGTAATQNTGTSGATIPLNSGANTESGATTFSAAGAASSPGVSITGAPYTGGTGTTTFPLAYLNGGGTGPTTFSTSGTELGINAPSGFVGNFLDFHVNGGASLFNVSSSGGLLANGAAQFNSTGTFGNNLAVSANFAAYLAVQNTASATSSTCTNSGPVNFFGRYWNGAANAVNTISLTPTCTGGTNGVETLTAANTAGSTGQFTFAVTGNLSHSQLIIPSALYSAAGTALPTCAVGIKGAQATVSDATSPTAYAAYTSGGGVTAGVICSYNGSTYSWLID